MYRSADRAAAVLALAALALTTTATTSTAITPTAMPLTATTPTVTTPAAPVVVTPTAGPVTQALVLDLEAPVLDLTLTSSSLDGSLTDAVGETERQLTLSSDVLFAFNKANLAATARTRLTQVATAIATAQTASSPVVVRVDGYTDSKGTAAYNARLSRQRAQAVADALRPLLAKVPVAVRVVGHGAANPVAPNIVDGKDNPGGRALNRRVTVSFATPDTR